MFDPVEKYTNEISKIKGWLRPVAAVLTSHILERQNASGISGNALEIGVYGGRYLAILAMGLTDRQRVIGIDPFGVEGTSAEQTMASLQKVGCADRVELQISCSDAFSSAQYFEWGPLRFMHVDGSHEQDDVAHDLAIAGEVLAKDGVVAIDDFLNPHCLGVTKAVFDHFDSPQNTGLVPMGFTPNKLFACRPDFASFYRDILAGFMDEYADRLNLKPEGLRLSKMLGREISVIHQTPQKKGAPQETRQPAA